MIRPRRQTRFTLFILLATFCSSISVYYNAAADIGPMSYQGRLLDTNGVPVNNTLPFIVRIYDDPTVSTNLLYQEEFTSITIDDGVYSLMLGNGDGSVTSGAWDINLWNNTPMYLEIEIDEETLNPRSKITSAPFAFQANLALTTNNALALGGKSADEYDSILADICVSSKGKWLELVEECLGIGSSFPGPTMVNWNSLSASDDFTDLDLSKADISGIDFSGADLSGSIFTNTTYQLAGLDAAILNNTSWDNANSTDSSAVILTNITELNSSSFSNMDMSDWNMSNLTLVSGLGAGNLSACPSQSITNWECREMSTGSGRWFLAGPGVNLAAGSPASIFRFGSSYLDLERNALAGLDLTNAVFVGNIIRQDFSNTNLTQANFDFSHLKYSRFTNAVIDNTSFVGGFLDKAIFNGAVPMTNTNFIDATLSYVDVLQPMVNADFTQATLKDVQLTGLTDGIFNNAVLDSLSIGGELAGVNTSFLNTRFYNDFHVSNSNNNDAPSFVFQGNVFNGGVISGDLQRVTINTPVFIDVHFKELDLCLANLPQAPQAYDSVTWTTVRCPDGLNSNFNSQSCLTDLIPFDNCSSPWPPDQ